MVLLGILAALFSGLAVQVYGYYESKDVFNIPESRLNIFPARPLALQRPEIYDPRLNIPDLFFGANDQVIAANKSNLVKRQQRKCDPGYVPVRME